MILLYNIYNLIYSIKLEYAAYINNYNLLFTKN